MALTCSTRNLSGQLSTVDTGDAGQGDLFGPPGERIGLPLDGHWRLHAP
jgi:hypothetical protein